jgi:hypothetical protein
LHIWLTQRNGFVAGHTGANAPHCDCVATQWPLLQRNGVSAAHCEQSSFSVQV